MRSVHRLILVVTAVTMLVASSLPTVAADPAPDEGCQPVAIMAIRGSGEDPIGEQHYRDQTSHDGAEGKTLQRLLHAYAYSSGYDESLLGNVPVVGLAGDYPAVDVNTFKEVRSWYATDSPVWNSAEEGTVAAIRKMGEFQRNQPTWCGTTQWVLVGYSQGAMVAHFTYEVMASRIASMYLVGDPLQLPNGPGNSGGGANGAGIVVTQFPGKKAGSQRYYASRRANSITYCHNNDIICDFGVYPWGAKYHEDYFTTEAEKQAEGRRLAAIVISAKKHVATPVVTKPAAEIMFAIDTTGSMSSYIAAARNRARALGQQVLDSSPESRVGLVEYRDHGDDFVARTVVPLTRDVDSFSSGLDGLYASQGGDFPESVYSGMLEALNASWSPSATHAVAVIGDAPAHDPEPVTGYTGSTVAARFHGEPAPVAVAASRRLTTAIARTASTSGPSALVFGLSANGELSDQLQEIVPETGGKVFGIGDDGSVGELMSEVLEETTANPVAALSVGLSVEGDDTVMSAVDSTGDGSLTFDFDLDGDGSFEKADVDPTQSIGLSPGVHTVGVRVSDSRGRFATASAQVTTAPRSEAFRSAFEVPVPLTGVRLASDQVGPGQPINIVVPSASASDGTWLFTALHKQVDPPTAPALAHSDTTVLPATPQLLVPTDATPGMYRLDLFGENGRYAALPVRVAAVSTTTTPPIRRLATRITARSKSAVRHGRRLWLVAHVTAPHQVPTGFVSVRDGRRTVAYGRLARGRVVLHTKRLSHRGAHRLIVRFAGNRYMTPSQTYRRVRVR